VSNPLGELTSSFFVLPLSVLPFERLSVFLHPSTGGSTDARKLSSTPFKEARDGDTERGRRTLERRTLNVLSCPVSLVSFSPLTLTEFSFE